jgi:hypothetical protein
MSNAERRPMMRIVDLLLMEDSERYYKRFKFLEEGLQHRGEMESSEEVKYFEVKITSYMMSEDKVSIIHFVDVTKDVL